MIDKSERFPQTAEGIKAAQEKAGPNGEWAEYIDWWGDDSDVVSRRTLVAEAIRQGADVSPALAAEVGLVSTKTISSVGEVAIVGVVNNGGYVDIPETPHIPNQLRANLPA